MGDPVTTTDQIDNTNGKPLLLYCLMKKMNGIIDSYPIIGQNNVRLIFVNPKTLFCPKKKIQHFFVSSLFHIISIMNESVQPLLS